MRRLFFDVIESYDEMYVCIAPPLGHKLELTEDELAFVEPLLGVCATQTLPVIWYCGDDANVGNRLAVPPLIPGGRATTILRFLESQGALGDEEDDEDEDDEDE